MAARVLVITFTLQLSESRKRPKEEHGPFHSGHILKSTNKIPLIYHYQNIAMRPRLSGKDAGKHSFDLGESGVQLN